MGLRICHLYPKLMNIYGDRGNILSLVRRCRWRGIEVEVEELEEGDGITSGRYDIFFMGGGQDREQVRVCDDLDRIKGNDINREIEAGAAALVICGGYQLFGRSYRPFEGEELPGIGVFDAYTVAGSERFIGNVVAKSAVGGRYGTVVGFENHSGLTYLGEGCYPMGIVTVGRGNNGEDRTEGAIYKGAIGTYLHGSLLPKNPSLADFLIAKGLQRREEDVGLSELEDSLEWKAHRVAVERSRKTG
jgi:lipid II isoglutaminyl synthase (glutamine-hydrolysing)